MWWPFQTTRLVLAALTLTMALALLSSLSYGQVSPAFDVASVKPSLQRVGPDDNNQIAFLPDGIRASNVTLQRLIAEAYQLQLNQILGPRWIDQNEYELEARATTPAPKEQLAFMLRNLLEERFGLKQHNETRTMRTYELVVAKDGPKIQPVAASTAPAIGPGFPFLGSMRQLADLIAIQLTLPAASAADRPILASGPQTTVLDRTHLTQTYSFRVNPEPSGDAFTAWQRLLQEHLD